MTPTSDHLFPTGVTGLPPARATEVVSIANEGSIDLRLAPVVKQVGDASVRMLAYNGSIPGPTLKVQEGSEIVVDIENQGDMETTVHWHGLRLENRFDGTHETQAPIAIGDRFSARVSFPDPGAYWYHPHIRQDYGQEMGLYGCVLVEPADPDYWPPVHREIVMTLDDILLEDGEVAAFSRAQTTHSAMGRFGDVLLVNGETDLAMSARLGEVVRFYLTNTANTRVFKVTVPGARMKLVGGDSGRVEHEEFVDDVVLAPSERVVVDVLFTQPGQVTLEHHTPNHVYRLAAIEVSQERAAPPLQEQFEALRTNADMVAERQRIQSYLNADPDKTLAFLAEMDMGEPTGDTPTVYGCPMHPQVVSETPGHCPDCGMKLLAVEAPPSTYGCPMHPQVVSETPGHCPDCGMKLLAVEAPPSTYGCPMHPEVVSETPGHCPDCGMKLLPSQLMGNQAGHEGHDAAGGPEHQHGATADGIEWEDDMVEVNRMTTPSNMHWNLVDRHTDAVNHDIQWRFTVGDQVKIRLMNEMAGDHPMHHPFHVHGAGRFLILARDGDTESNLVWKDTVLVRTGETVDILLDVTNAGRWMAHCHIAEHHESGMMFSFDVDPATSH